MTEQPRAYRAALLYSLDDPARVGVAASYRYLEDGLLLVEAGRIRALGSASQLLAQLPAGTPLLQPTDERRRTGSHCCWIQRSATARRSAPPIPICRWRSFARWTMFAG